MAGEFPGGDDGSGPDLCPDCRDGSGLDCGFANGLDCDHHVAYLDSFDRYSATNDVYLHIHIFHHLHL